MIYDWDKRENVEKVYDRSVVRQYLYEYLTKKCRMSRVLSLFHEGRHFFMAKAVKDYLIMVGKKTFTYDDIQHLIESNAILNYASDMFLQMMKMVYKHN